MAAFDEITFPVAISRGSSAGPTLRYDVVEFDSGVDSRIAKWPIERRTYNAGVGIESERPRAQLMQVYNFYLARDGISRGFRFGDPLDYSSAADQKGTPDDEDQVLGQGDGTNASFQLKRVIDDTFNSRTRIITKPRVGSVVVAVDGSSKSEGTHYTVDYSSGIVQFTGGNIPVGGGTPEVVTAGFLFDVPCQFASELQSLEILVGQFEQGQIPSIPIEEIVGDVVTPYQWPRGGSSRVSLSVNTLYDNAMGATVAWAPTVSGLQVTLPLAASIEIGGPIYHFINTSGVHSMSFRNREDGTEAFSLGLATGAVVCLADILGTRTWMALKGTT